jgi:hypothetical protein
MTNEQFIERFEACTLPADGFHHREHIKVVWLYLQRYPVLETLVRFSESLKRFAAAHGKPNLYHETITWAYVFLINERLQRSGLEQNWPEFVERNADLFDWDNSILKTYYCQETLRSDLARKTFIFPDNLCPTAGSADVSSALSASARTGVSLGVPWKDR